ncbi:MAG: hypothetical protein HY391_00870 [Deltaproteobacteria bacterium]|nr:hypothetical protein [Deltaproteobacteria bacterium]
MAEQESVKPQRRKRILVNTYFQLKWAAYFVLIALVTTVIVGAAIYFITQGTANFLIAHGLHRSPDIFAYIGNQRALIYGSLAVIFLFLAVILFVAGVFLTHRVAGPLYALNRKMLEMAQGNYENTLRFRKKDEFRFLASSYNGLVSAVRKTVNKDLEYIARLETLLAGKGVPADVAARAKEELSHYRQEKEVDLTRLSSSPPAGAS